MSDAAAPAPPSAPCWDDSRRLTGPNLFFAETGAVLEALGPQAQDAAAHARWRARVQTLRRALGWPAELPLALRCHAGGAQLALAAPEDQLFTATEVNEWAWQSACEVEPSEPLSGAASRLAAQAAAERDARLAALRDAARAHALPLFADDDVVSVGAGRGCRAFARRAMPDAAALRWDRLHDIPTALVTGSNGKTTTARLVAAMLAATGRNVGLCGTEGVAIAGETIARGDYSGPAGARLVLRHPEVDAAVLETARGGILRRGLATTRADVAVVTNLSADHFGEYGIASLEDLADVKLIVARTLGDDGTLVLNADDPLLLARAPVQRCRVALFAYDDTHAGLAALRRAGRMTCGVGDGRLRLHRAGEAHDLGAVAAMPLAHGGAARHNVANAAAAALAAAALGMAPQAIAATLARFGRSPADNPGRLERHDWRGATILVDYAHNPEGLAALLAVAASFKPGRLAMLLGQAGNRDDAAIADLARVAASAGPDRVLVKELPAMLRGRAPGEVPALLLRGLREAGIPEARIAIQPDEAAAARELLDWSRPGDVVVLPLHQPQARAEIVALLDQRPPLTSRIAPVA